MKLVVNATGSTGNSYFLENSDGEILLLDLGIRPKLIFKSVKFRLRNVVGAIVSHCHKDHSLGTDGVKAVGIPIYAPYKDPAVPKLTRLGKYTIVAFKLPHDGTENYGFLIRSDGHTFVYLTDYEYCPVTFREKKVDTMLIECNYIDSLVNMDDPKTSHVLKGHASLDTVKGIIHANRTEYLRNVIICHMSRGNGDPERMAAEIAEEFHGINVYIARPGLELEF